MTINSLWGWVHESPVHGHVNHRAQPLLVVVVGLGCDCDPVMTRRRLFGILLMALALLLIGPVWLLPFFLPITLLGALLSFCATFAVVSVFSLGLWLVL
jgi:hypothetical protein